LAESHKLDPQCFDEGPRPKSHKWRLNLNGHHFGGKAIGSDPPKKRIKKELKGEKRVHDLEDQVASYGPRQGST
jgi:hypothetical protein